MRSLTGCRIQEWNTYWLIRVKVLTLAEGEQSTHAFKESDRNSWVGTKELERGMGVGNGGEMQGKGVRSEEGGKGERKREGKNKG